MKLPSDNSTDSKIIREFNETPFFYNHQFSYLEISKDALKHNIHQYKNIVPSKAFLAPVIKANAYGHGLGEIAHLLEETPEVNYMCVASLSEALYLRRQNITKSILVLSILDLPLTQAIIHNIDIVVHNKETLQEADQASREIKKRIVVHIKVDTGLSRLGVHHLEAETFINYCLSLPNINVKGIFSHYIDAEDYVPTYCPLQQKRFEAIIKKYDTIPLKHASCSAALSSFDTFYTFCRFGIGLYGLWPSLKSKQLTKERYPNFSLQPVMQWKTKIISIKELPSQSAVSYNATFKTNKPTRIAVLPIGYWDGYDRKLSNTGYVKIKNKFAPVLGRITMNMTIVDLHSIKNVSIGDTVTLLGPETKINADTLARKCKTINYEIVTRINPLLPRIIT